MEGDAVISRMQGTTYGPALNDAADRMFSTMRTPEGVTAVILIGCHLGPY